MITLSNITNCVIVTIASFITLSSHYSCIIILFIVHLLIGLVIAKKYWHCPLHQPLIHVLILSIVSWLMFFSSSFWSGVQDYFESYISIASTIPSVLCLILNYLLVNRYNKHICTLSVLSSQSMWFMISNAYKSRRDFDICISDSTAVEK